MSPRGSASETAPLIKNQATSPAIHYYKELFPSLLTISLFAVYGSAIVNGIRLANDPSSKYWIGQWGYVTLLVPFLVILSHVVQSYYRKPMYLPVIMSCALPPLIFLISGYTYYIPVNQIVERLLSTDCTTFRTKFHIEQAYLAANTFYTDCVVAEAMNRSVTEEVVRADKVIQQCPNYDLAREAAGYGDEWDYLSELEHEETCSGWCYIGEQALWTHNSPGWDSCSAAAGATMNDAVSRNAMRMMVNGIFNFFVAAIVIFLINEMKDQAGDDW